MIGNDIVDLQLAAKQSNWQRRGFLQKIFTEKEQATIFEASCPEKYVWLLWSMKEAAYKAHQRCFCLKPRYNPKKFECTLYNFSRLGKVMGEVSFENETYACTSELCGNYCSTIAQKEQQSEIIISEFVPEYYLRDRCTVKVAQCYNIPSEMLEIKKDAYGIPHFFQEKRKLKIPFSLTHHGKLAAFAFLKNEK